jgi:hypothetical protein
LVFWTKKNLATLDDGLKAFDINAPKPKEKPICDARANLAFGLDAV